MNTKNDKLVDWFAAVLVMLGFASLYAAVLVDAGWLS